MKERDLTFDDSYRNFFPCGDKKSKGIQQVLATFEQTAFGKDCSEEDKVTVESKYQNFLKSLKIVLLACNSSWNTLTRYQKSDHISACLIVAAGRLSNLPKKDILDAFKSFKDDSLKSIKIRYLKKTKLFTGIEDL